MSSFRLTNTARSAFRKSPWSFRSMNASARVASVTRRGPASSPASCSKRANAPSRGSRSTSGTPSLLDQRGHLVAHALQVFLVLERRTHRRADQAWVDARRTQRSEGARPVEGLRHAWDLVQVHPAQSLTEAGHFAREP